MQEPEGESNVITISNVTVKGLTRSHHHAKLSCEASNTHLALPPKTTVTIELNMKPLKVEISEKNKTLSAGNKYEVECRSTGSKPTAILTWWKTSKQLKKPVRNFQEGSTSVSVLHLIPTIEDDGKFLACRAENPKLPEAAIEDRWKLKVHYHATRHGTGRTNYTDSDYPKSLVVGVLKEDSGSCTVTRQPVGR
ncbi:hypothetical protein M0802_009789 [Mischocyttarus mexicanus]|nr:hypothetical protein M0802_009789 [Mischocyttarus mexicanus]